MKLPIPEILSGDQEDQQNQFLKLQIPEMLSGSPRRRRSARSPPRARIQVHLEEIEVLVLEVPGPRPQGAARGRYAPDGVSRPRRAKSVPRELEGLQEKIRGLRLRIELEKILPPSQAGSRIRRPESGHSRDLSGCGSESGHSRNQGSRIRRPESGHSRDLRGCGSESGHSRNQGSGADTL